MKYAQFIFLLILFSCQTGKSKTENKPEEISVSKGDKEFLLYLDNFKKLELPLVIKACNNNSSGLKEFEGGQFAKFADEYNQAYGQIPTNGNYTATITLAPADCYLPVLTTYKSNGQIIDKKTIAIGYCGSDCGYNCEEFMTIKKDFSFYTSDTISTYTCDSLGNETPGTYEYYVIYIKGKLRTDGKIEMSKEIRKPLPGRKEEP